MKKLKKAELASIKGGMNKQELVSAIAGKAGLTKTQDLNSGSDLTGQLQ